MNNNNGSENNFSSGLLLGILIGAAAVFLLGTKRGKKLLRIILDEGVDGVCNVLDKVDKGIDLDDILEGEEMPYSEIPEKNELKKHEENFSYKENEEIGAEEKLEERPKVKRFFKGVSRHLN